MGPPLVESLKKLSKEQFHTTIMNGRPEKGMPPFSASKMVERQLGRTLRISEGALRWKDQARPRLRDGCEEVARLRSVWRSILSTAPAAPAGQLDTQGLRRSEQSAAVRCVRRWLREQARRGARPRSGAQGRVHLFPSAHGLRAPDAPRAGRQDQRVQVRRDHRCARRATSSRQPPSLTCVRCMRSWRLRATSSARSRASMTF